MLDARAQQLVATLGLKPHPEGGFFPETFRSAVKVMTPRGERSACTAIYYLLPGDRFSPLHRVPGGAWQAAKALGDWALVGCIVAPGFEFQDFEMPACDELLRQLPTHRALVERLTREDV